MSSYLELSSYKVLRPLLDALKWHGSSHRLNESLNKNNLDFSTDDFIETMSVLKFAHHDLKNIKGVNLEKFWLPLLVVNGDHHNLILEIDGDYALIFDGNDGLYKKIALKEIKGHGHFFQSSNDAVTSKPGNWFNKLIYKFKASLLQIAFLTFTSTILDLLIPLFVILIYNQISQISVVEGLLIISIGIILYLAASFTLGLMRAKITDYISARMGSIISYVTYSRLLYLSPSYTETASVNSQINRIKDFENLKRFVASGLFLNLLDLIFASVYLIVIFMLGGWLGYIPVVTFIIVFLIGMLMRPFHKLKMEALSEDSSQKQQQLLEILKNTDNIRFSNVKDFWIERFKKLNAQQIYNRYALSDYVNFSNSFSYFICNASVLLFIYGGVIRVFDQSMSMGALIGILMLYWKVIASARGAFSLSVQVNGLVKSINQINRFMNLPQDSQIDEGQKPVKPMKGNVVFKDVSIKYNANSDAALLNVSFGVTPGEIVGITGHDGSGKTTVLKLILGMYKPQSGRVLIDNFNIRQLEPLSLRQSISYASSEDVIFSGCLKDNFTNYNPNLKDVDLDELIEKTGRNEYLKLHSLKLDSILTEKDISELSPSFKKLFNLTRLLCRKVKLYLIDEPESYLNESELSKIMKLLELICVEEKATMIIATKSAVIMALCNQTINLNEGRISQ